MKDPRLVGVTLRGIRKVEGLDGARKVKFKYRGLLYDVIVHRGQELNVKILSKIDSIEEEIANDKIS